MASIKKRNLRETTGFDSGLFKCNFRKSDTGGKVKLFHYSRNLKFSFFERTKIISNVKLCENIN